MLCIYASYIYILCIYIYMYYDMYMYMYIYIYYKLCIYIYIVYIVYTIPTYGGALTIVLAICFTSTAPQPWLASIEVIPSPGNANTSRSLAAWPQNWMGQFMIVNWVWINAYEYHF